MSHNRKLVLGGVALVKERIRNDMIIISFLRDELEKILIDNHYFDSVPFKWIGVIFRYGLKNDLVPEYEKINRKYGDLPVAIEIKMAILEWADKNDLDMLRDIFMVAALDTLIHIGKKYGRPIDFLIQMRKSYQDLPNSVEECIKVEGNGQGLKTKDGASKRAEGSLEYMVRENKEAARVYFIRMLNDEFGYELFKKNIRNIPRETVEELIDMTLSRSSFHEKQCAELRDLLNKIWG